jgi:hypothetical protein
MQSTSLDALTDPGFSAVFENVGNVTITLNRRVVPSIRIYDAAGALMRAPITIVCECPMSPRRTREDLIQIPPGQSWTFALPPHYPRYRYNDEMATYMVYGKGLALPEGRYTARFTYVSFSNGLDSASYDVRELHDVWEGRQESEPISFSIAPGADSRVPQLASRALPWTERDGASGEIARRLTSGDRNDVDAAMRLVGALRWKAAVPVLVWLLGSEDPWWRGPAAGALVNNLGVEGLHDRMRSLVDDQNRSVAESASQYLLTRECVPDDIPLLETRFSQKTGISFAYINCGDAAAFPKLRGFLTSDPMTRWASVALSRLTFRPGGPDADIPTITAAEWDAWYQKHRRESRKQWAITAVREPERPGSFHAAAFDYLRRQNDRRWLADFRRGATSEQYATRIAAVRGIAQFERVEGIALLRRELNHRSGDAFSSAVDALNALTGQYLDFDFTLPKERQRAIEAYSSAR